MRQLAVLLLFFTFFAAPAVSAPQVDEKAAQKAIADSLYRAAQEKFEAEDFEEAAAAFSLAALVTENEADQALTYLWAGYSYTQAEMWEESLAPLEKSIAFLQTKDEFKDDLLEALEIKLGALLELKRWGEATEVMRLKVALNDPNDPFIWRMNPENGELFHGVTETRFPAESGPFTRARKTDYNAESTDISVGYVAGTLEGNVALTIYLSKYPGLTNEAYYASGRGVIEDQSKAFESLLEEPFEISSKDGAFSGLKGRFRIEELGGVEGIFVTELWTIQFGDWLMKIRYSYPPSHENSEEDLLALLKIIGWPTHLADQ